MTALSRASAIMDALLNTTVDNTIKQEVADAFTNYNKEYVIGAGLDPAALTNEQKAQVFLMALRKVVRNTYANYKYNQTIETVEDTAAGNATTAETAIGTEPNLT